MSSVRRSARAAAAPAPSKPSEPKSDTSIDPALQPQPQPRSQSSAPSAPVDPVNDAPSDMYLSACHSVDGFLNSPSARPGNAVWNLMGQVAMVAGKEAIIMTPHTPSFPSPGASEKPPAPKLKVVITDDAAELPSVPPGHDLIPCWISKLMAYWDGYEASRLKTKELEIALLEDGNESTLWFQPRELSIKALTWSPNGLSKAGGCLLAVLDTSLRITVRAAATDWLRGDFEVVADVTKLIADVLKAEADAADADEEMDGVEKRTAIERALELQSLTLAWSMAPVFDSPLGTKADASLLAVGSRGGSFVLLGHQHDQQFSVLHRSPKLTDQYISHLAWSEWKPAGDGSASRVAALFCACPDGSIFSVNVTRTPVENDMPALLVSSKRIVYEADLRTVSGLTYCHGVLAWVKTGTVQILSEEGYVETFQLNKMGEWAGCTAYAAPAGINPLPGSGLLVSMNSGEQHIFTEIQDDPRYDTKASKMMTDAMRKTLLDIDPDLNEIQIAPRVGGCALAPNLASGGSHLLAMINEPFNLIDLSIPLDSMRQVWVSLTDLSTVDSRKADEQSAASDLFSLQSAPSAALPQLARIKRKLAVTRSDVEAAAKPRRLKPTSRQSATEVLRYELTCSMEISALHESLALANWEQVEDEDDVTKRTVAEQTATNVETLVTRNILNWIQSVRQVDASSFNESGAFISRILENVTSRSLHRTDAETMQSYQKLAPMIHQEKREETCPVCSQPALLEPGGQAYRCGQGHAWGRCAVTLTLVETPFVRRCVTCQRRAKVEDAQMSPLERDLLSAATTCFWCGGSWRRVF